jgi:Flp pilus assembly secretin CpaC
VAIVATGVMLSASIGAQVAAPAASSSIVKSQHLRLPFTRDIQRIAVGDQDIAAVEIVTNRELLVLGRETGRTTLIVWFTDGSLAERTITVQRDLSILQTALQRVHPSIAVESAPDRDAIVLTGRVPDLTVSQLAESIARSYLDAGNGRGNAARPLLAAPPQPAVAPPDAAAAPQAPGAAQAPTPATGQAQPAARLQSEVPPSGTIINLIQLDRIPLLPEEKIKDAIRPLGGDRVTVRRVLRGNVRNDELDTLVLEGEVPNQIALVRILQVAAQLFAARTVGEDEVQVLADEGGGLASRGLDTQVQQSGNFGARGSNNVFGGGSGGGQGARLTNQVRRNVARATAISVADGRILSFIVVKDLPQIRVNIRVYEVNREKLRSYTPVTAAVASTEQLPSTDTSPAANAAQGQAASYPSGSAVQNVLGFLAGGFLNQFQFTSDHVAISQALALIEREGIARTLSSPSLTVLSGEIARFQVGGEVPIPVAFTPAVGGETGGVPGLFNSVDFVSFGVQLEIRPLVGEDDTITLDVQPQVVTPDAALTASLRVTTGTEQTTTAFSTRALRTSSRLPDGQTLLIGGLTTQNATLNTAKTPGLGDVPGFGWFFKSFNRSDDLLDLVIVVNPVILRTPLPETALWAFPSADELLKRVAGDSGPTAASPDRSPMPATPR